MWMKKDKRREREKRKNKIDWGEWYSDAPTKRPKRRTEKLNKNNQSSNNIGSVFTIQRGLWHCDEKSFPHTKMKSKKKLFHMLTMERKFMSYLWRKCLYTHTQWSLSGWCVIVRYIDMLSQSKKKRRKKKSISYRIYFLFICTIYVHVGIYASIRSISVWSKQQQNRNCNIFFFLLLLSLYHSGELTWIIFASVLITNAVKLWTMDHNGIDLICFGKKPQSPNKTRNAQGYIFHTHTDKYAGF